MLELDSEVDTEVQILKRSLLAQVGVAEYSKVAQWVNPCPSFMLPDVFCSECHESRDVNLCYLPVPEEEETIFARQWMCEDCGTPYDVNDIEDRVVDIINKKMLRYQLQDIRDCRTHRVITRKLPKLSECSTGLKLDITPEEARSELSLLKGLAEFHDLQFLKQITEGILGK